MRCKARHVRTTPSGEGFQEVQCTYHRSRMHVGKFEGGEYTWPLLPVQENLQTILAIRLSELSRSHAEALGACRMGRPLAEVEAILAATEGPLAKLEMT